MKNIFSRVFSILTAAFIPFAGVVFALAISSCSGVSESDTASVSFSLSPELAKTVLSASRAADDATDAEATGTDGTSTEPTAQEGEQNTKPYRIEVSMSGAVSSTQTKTYSETEWAAIAAGKGKNETFTFNDIPVGSEVSISATIYLDRGGHLVWPYMTGTARAQISAGENLVPVNVHKLARVNIYNNTGSVEAISDISQLDVYALSETSSTALRVFELLGSGTSSSDIDSEIYEKLSAESRIYSYSKPNSPYLTGGYELKDGQKAYMFTLLYTDAGDVYAGYPAETSDLTPDTTYTLTTINIDDINYIYVYLKKLDLDYTYIFPAKYAGKTVSAWYVGENIDENADYNGEVAVTKTEYSATFLFSDGTFVVTSHSKKVDSSGIVWKEKIHYVMRGTYEVSRGDFETGLLVLTPSAMYEANDNSSVQGWIELSDTQVEQNIMSCEVSSGSFTPPSEQMEEPYPFYKKADDAYLRVYRGEIDDSKASSQSSGDDPETSIDYRTLCFFPTGYEDKTVAAWYATEEVTSSKSKFLAVYLFNDNTFIATKREVTDSGETRKIEMQGSYTLSTAGAYSNNTGTANDTYNITIANGVFSVSGVETTYMLQSGRCPEASSVLSESDENAETGALPEEFDIQFLFQTEKGGDEYEENDELPTFHCSESTSMQFEQIISGYTTQAIQLGYEYNEEKSDEKPVYDEENKVWIIRIYFDIAELEVAFTATSATATDSNNATEKYTQTGFTLTAYNNLTYVVTYSNESGTVSEQVVSRGTYDDVSGSDTSISVTETEYFDFVNTDDMSALASGTPTLQTVTSPTAQTIDFSDGTFTVTCAGGVTITFSINAD